MIKDDKKIFKQKNVIGFSSGNFSSPVFIKIH